MRLRDVLADAALLAPGRAVLVLSAKGEAYVPPLPPAPPVVEPEPLAEQLTRVEQSGVAARAALMEVAAKLDEWGNVVRAVASGQETGQKEILSSVASVERTLLAPVKPVYDKAGKLVGAQRVAKLKGA